MLKAVLIDDEEIALDVLEIMLEEVGGVTIAARFLRVEEALAYLSDAQIDLIFLDIEMPVMNGLEAAGRLLLLCPDTPVIFVTAYHEYAVESFDVNAFGYLLKPVSRERLAKTLERYRQRIGPGERVGGSIADSDGGQGSGKGKQVTAESAGSGGSARLVESVESVEGVGTVGSLLYLNVLGSMELYDNDRNLVKWRTKKTKELFVYLWHYDGTPIQRDRILDDLWPELLFDKAQMLFHTTLYHLRNTLKNAGFSNMVMFGDERYWMRNESIVSDTEQLKKWLSNPETILDGIREMIQLYRGDYLESECYAWANERRMELRATYLQQLQRLLSCGNEDSKAEGAHVPHQASEGGESNRAREISRDGNIGRFSGSGGIAQPERVAVLRKMIALEPYDETYYRWLLSELKDAGDGAATKALRKLMIQRFRDDLGLDIRIE